jgi:hypothetical protein
VDKIINNDFAGCCTVWYGKFYRRFGGTQIVHHGRSRLPAVCGGLLLHVSPKRRTTSRIHVILHPGDEPQILEKKSELSGTVKRRLFLTS